MRIVILIVALAILLQLTAVTQALKQEGKFQLRLLVFQRCNFSPAREKSHQKICEKVFTITANNSLFPTTQGLTKLTFARINARQTWESKNECFTDGAF